MAITLQIMRMNATCQIRTEVAFTLSAKQVRAVAPPLACLTALLPPSTRKVALDWGETCLLTIDNMSMLMVVVLRDGQTT